jgi:quercetin dioxygenase-like cupin family protein
MNDQIHFYNGGIVMNARKLMWAAACAALLLLAAATQAQEVPAQPGMNLGAMKFSTVPPFPTCATASVVNGNPATGPSIIAAKATPGCIFPWHWHTPNEHIIIVSGSASLQMKDGKAVTLQSGAFALMPSHHVHQFKCLRACMLYVYSDSAFDMHYVDKDGNEIQPADALKPYRETVATGMK